MCQRTRPKSGQCRDCDARCHALVATAPALSSFYGPLCNRHGAPRRSERPEALLCHNTLLHKAVMLLHDVVEVLNGSVQATARQVARALQTRDGRWVNGSEISVDDAWCRSAVADRTPEPALGGLFCRGPLTRRSQ
jgi:hypothetical protein